MTASIAGLGTGEDTPLALRPKRSTHPRGHEWQSVYLHELLQKQDTAIEKRVPEKKVPAAAPSPSRPPDSEHGSPRLRAVAIAVGGHLELRFVAGASTEVLGSLAAEALVSGASRDSSASAAESPPPDTRAAWPAARAAVPLGLSGEGAVAPRQPRKPGQSPRGAPSDREQALARVASRAVSLTAGALACVPVAPPGKISDGAARTGSETPVPLATALTLAASQALMSLSAGTAGSSQKHGQESQSRQSGSEDAAHGSAAGPAGISHGTFPLIVSGQLMELEFVSLGAGANSGHGAAQQIVMSVQPPGSPRFELTARKLDGKVAVTVGPSAGADGDALSGTGLDLPSLLRRLGWGSLPVELTDTGAVR